MASPHFHNSQTAGSILVELLVAIALTGIMLPAVFSAAMTSRDGRAQQEERLQATRLLRQTEEELRLAAENSWSQVSTAGTFYPVRSGTTYSLGSGTEIVDGQMRFIVLSSVQRDSTGGIVGAGGIVDPSTQQAILSVSWTSPIPQTLTKTIYLTRTMGNTSSTHTSVSDFASGTLTNTMVTANGGGTVQLLISTASATLTDDYTTANDYTFDSSKIEVTGGLAQLKSSIASASGNTSNSGFSSNLTGWTFSSYGTNVTQTGTRISSGGNPGGYAQLNFPRNRNAISGGYFSQPITTTVSSPTANLAFQWRITAFQSGADNFRVLAFVDSTNSAPILGQEVWNSGVISSTTAWSGTVNVNVATKLLIPGTYYVKLVGYVDYPSGNRGPYTIGFDNAVLSWSGSSTSYASDSPSVTQNTSFQPPGLQQWSSFAAVEVANGGNLRYQLSTDDGTTWNYFSGGWISATSAAQSNPFATINSNMSSVATTSGKLRIRAFLNGNGAQQVRLDSVTVGYTGNAPGPYSGSYTAPSIDVGSSVGFNRILFSDTNTAATTTQFQIATNTDNSTFNYVGPDGTSSTYFTGGSGKIPLTHTVGRYLRYKIDFSSTTSDIPSVQDVTINYSP